MKRILFIVLLLLVTSAHAFAGMAEDREAMFVRLIDKNVIQKIELDERTSIALVYVKPLFYELDYEFKSDIINIVWAYYLEKNNNLDQKVVLLNNQTGKVVGGFTTSRGLIWR